MGVGGRFLHIIFQLESSSTARLQQAGLFSGRWGGGGLVRELKIWNWVCSEAKENSELRRYKRADFCLAWLLCWAGAVCEVLQPPRSGHSWAQLSLRAGAGAQPGPCGGQGEELRPRYGAFSEGSVHSLRQTLRTRRRWGCRLAGPGRNRLCSSFVPTLPAAPQGPGVS